MPPTLKFQLKKKPKTKSSSKSSNSSSTKDTTSKLSPFDPRAKYHLVSELPGDDPQFDSFQSLTELCAKTEEILGAAKKDGALPKIRIIAGQRCPVSTGPLPKALIEGKWVPLVKDAEAAIEDCPENGAILGDEEVETTEDGLGHLDTEEAPPEEVDERTMVIPTLTAPKPEHKVAQVFSQDRE